jgi:O-acetylhomoserine/O-acetylserine sulfhydrylase-like pyridoxal-dependent enzyme
MNICIKYFVFVAITYSTGCAATMAALNLLKVGDHILSASDIYGGTHHLLKTTAEDKGVQLDFFDVNKLDTIDMYFKANTRV